MLRHVVVEHGEVGGGQTDDRPAIARDQDVDRDRIHTGPEGLPHPRHAEPAHTRQTQTGCQPSAAPTSS